MATKVPLQYGACRSRPDRPGTWGRPRGIAAPVGKVSSRVRPLRTQGKKRHGTVRGSWWREAHAGGILIESGPETETPLTSAAFDATRCCGSMRWGPKPLAKHGARLPSIGPARNGIWSSRLSHGPAPWTQGLQKTQGLTASAAGNEFSQQMGGMKPGQTT